MATRIALACTLSVGLLGSAAPGMQPVRPIDSRDLVRLDQTRQDTGPLSTSLLMQPTDLRVPLDFEDVYRIGGPRGDGERLARISGGLAAVFPRSTYRVTSKGVQAQVPPGTVFYLGSLPAEPASASRVSPVAAAMFANTRASTTAPASARIGRHEPAMAVRTQSQIRQDVSDRDLEGCIMTDEAYRGARVRALLETAAASSQASR